jgi:nicotinate-nucleotide adenylyltransferase
LSADTRLGDWLCLNAGVRVALFGGSFNPPHLGHQLVALSVLETKDVDELWLIPCFRHAFDKALVPFADRFVMCERAARALGPRVKVSDVEARLGGESRTLLTVQALAREHAGVSFAWVIGADLAREVSTWYHAEELLQQVSLITVGRAGYPGPGGVEMPAVSSTEVRRRLAAGDAQVDALVPRLVLDYIRERKLYGG